MGGEIKFEFDQVTVKNIEKRLGRMKSEAPKALKNALNATAKDARKDLATEAQRTYAVKVGGFNQQMKIKPASTGNLVAVINSTGAHLEMIKFSVYGGKGSPVSVLINKKKGRKTFSGRVFKNKISRRGQSGGGHVAVAKFIGGNSKQPNRLKIQKLFSVSVPQMIGNKRDVYGIVEPNILDNLRNNVDKQVEKILGG